MNQIILEITLNITGLNSLAKEQRFQTEFKNQCIQKVNGQKEMSQEILTKGIGVVM